MHGQIEDSEDVGAMRQCLVAVLDTHQHQNNSVACGLINSLIAVSDVIVVLSEDVPGVRRLINTLTQQVRLWA